MEVWKAAVIGVFSSLLALLIFIPLCLFCYMRLSWKRKGIMKKEGLTDYEKDLVYLHQFPRTIAKQVPNMSPFAMKLETWLRMKKLHFKVVGTQAWSSKKQSPFIVLNGEEIPDSNFAIAHLTKHFQLDPREGLPAEEWAAGRAFLHLMEASLVWSYFYWRYTENSDLFAKVFQIQLPKPYANLIRFFMAKGMKKRCVQVGIGRHSPEDIYEIGREDIRAISAFLGNKKFLLGDTMTTVDCSLFGHLAQVWYVKSLPFPHRQTLEEQCTNVIDYLDRIKDNIWPDWEDITGQGEFS